MVEAPYFPWPLAEVELDADQAGRVMFFLIVLLYRKGVLDDDDIKMLKEIGEVAENDMEKLAFVIHGYARKTGIDVPQL